jgi:hypothetical protein
MAQSSVGCHVVLVTTETPDVVDLGDVVGSLQHYFSQLKRGPAAAPPTPVASPTKGAAGKRDSIAMPLSPTGGAHVGPPTILFDRVGLGGDPAAPVALEGVEFASAALQALHRVGETRRFDEKDPSMKEIPNIVVVGCPSIDFISALGKQSKHTVRMLITVTATESFPPPPTAAPVKGGPKKPDPKKAAAGKPGAKGGAAGEKTSSPSQTTRIESWIKKDSRFGAAVHYVRVHVPTAASAEGVVNNSILPELVSLEKNLNMFSAWLEDKQVTQVRLGRSEGHADEYDISAYSKNVGLLEHKAYPRAIGDTFTMPAVSVQQGGQSWRIDDCLSATIAQSQLNSAKDEAPVRNVQQLDTAALEQQLRERELRLARKSAEDAEAPATADDQPPGLESGEVQQAEDDNRLPRKGPPLCVQERRDIAPSDPESIQWMVRQFMKRSLGTLRLESDTAAELSNILKSDRRDVSDRTAASEGVVWAADALDARTERVRDGVATGDAKSVPSKRPVPVGTLLLRRACAAKGATMMGLHAQAQQLPQIDDDLIASIERSHTQREVQRGMSLTMLEQVAREEFPHLAKAGFQTQPYLYSEPITSTDMTQRVAQFADRFGEHNVKITRVLVDDAKNVNALSSVSSSAAQISKVPAPHEVIVAGVMVPIEGRSSVQGHRRCRATSSVSVASGMPSFPQYVQWNKAAASSPAIVSFASNNKTIRDALSTGLTNRATAAELLKQQAFQEDTYQRGSVVVGQSNFTIFPHDASIVEVQRRNASSGSSVEHISHTVRFAKDDLVSTLTFQSNTGSRSLVTTFDDATVFSIIPRGEEPAALGSILNNNASFGAAQDAPTSPVQRAPSPAVSEPQLLDSTAASRVTSSQRVSRTGTASKPPAAAEASMRINSASRRTQGGAIAVELGFEPPAPGQSANTTTLTAPRPAPSPHDAVRVDFSSIPVVDITVAYGDVSLQVDETESNLFFRFSNQNIRESVVEGTLDGETIQSFVEFEVGRRIDHTRGSVTRYFTSKSCQVLRADGSVATLIKKDTHPQPFWLITTAIGEQYSRGAFPGASHEQVKLENFFCDVRQSNDRENNCDVFSRADGVIMTFYRSQSGSYHTTVAMHADGTVLVSRPLTAGSSVDAPPALSALMKQLAAVESTGAVAFVVETPHCPRVFLYHPRVSSGERQSCMSGPKEFLVAFGDGTLLRRQVVPKFANKIIEEEILGPNVIEEVLLETTFSKAGESTVRYHHDTALAFVEAASVRLSPMTTTSIALCEGVGVFDLALGGFRVVDFRAHTTTVQDLFDTSAFPKVDANVATNQTQLLLSMAPIGYSPHVLPKKGRDALQATLAARPAEVVAIPTLVERLRGLTASYIVEHRLISKGPRRSQQAQLGATAVNASRSKHDVAAANSIITTQTSKDLVVSTLAQLRAADQEDSAAYDAFAVHPDHTPSVFGPFLTEVRPLLFVQYQDGSVAEFLCTQDIAPFVHHVNLAPQNVSVSRAYCSGEPGIEQLTFVGGEVAAFGKKSMRVSMEESPIEQAAWLPRTLLPPRRFLTASAQAMSQAEANKQVRMLLRYQPLSVTARLATAKHEVRRQDQILAMHNYNHSIQSSICVVPQEDIDAQNALREKYLHAKQPLMGTRAPQSPPKASLINEPPAAANPFANVAPYYAEEDVDDETPQQHVNRTQEGSPTEPFNAGDARKASMKHLTLNKVFSFEPKEVDFGPLIAGLRYAFPVTMHSHTTDTLLFEVFRPRRLPNGVQVLSVQSSRFMLSPLGKSTVFVMLNLPEDSLDSLQSDPADPCGSMRILRDTLRLECAQLKTVFQLSIAAHVSPSLSSVKSKLTTPTPPPHGAAVPRKPKVDTLHPPVSGKTLLASGYYADMAMNTSVQVVGPAV